MKRESRLSVLAAIAANVGIAAMKFIVAGLSGSSAMLSEGIHSLVDTGDGVLLWVGMNRSQRPPDDLHPFGHGKELYFWTLVVAILVFAVGGGMSGYEGITHLVHPHAPRHGGWTYAVIGGSALFESTSWLFAWRGFNKERAGRGVWNTITTGKDPTSFAVLFEDSAALLSLAVAFCGIWLSHRLDTPIPDALASLLIGAILMTTATLLVHATRRLLIGQSADPALIEMIRRTASEDADVERVGRILTVHFGPDQILAQVELSFSGRLRAEELVDAIARTEKKLRERCPALKYISLEAEPVAALSRRRRTGDAARNLA